MQYVPGRSGWGLHLQIGDYDLFAQFPVEGATEDVPVYRRHDVLMGLAGQPDWVAAFV